MTMISIRKQGYAPMAICHEIAQYRVAIIKNTSITIIPIRIPSQIILSILWTTNTITSCTYRAPQNIIDPTHLRSKVSPHKLNPAKDIQRQVPSPALSNAYTKRLNYYGTSQSPQFIILYSYLRTQLNDCNITHPYGIVLLHKRIEQPLKDYYNEAYLHTNPHINHHPEQQRNPYEQRDELLIASSSPIQSNVRKASATENDTWIASIVVQVS
jgi:hypothetical protein